MLKIFSVSKSSKMSEQVVKLVGRSIEQYYMSSQLEHVERSMLTTTSAFVVHSSNYCDLLYDTRPSIVWIFCHKDKMY